jgi:hypothetical protein
MIDEMSIIKLKSNANQIIHFGITAGRNQNNNIWGLKDKKKKITNTGMMCVLSA